MRCCHDSSNVFYLFPLTLPTYFTLPLPTFLSTIGTDATARRKQLLLMASYTPEGWVSKYTALWSIRKQCNTSILLKPRRWSLVTQNGHFGHTIGTEFIQTTCLFTPVALKFKFVFFLSFIIPCWPYHLLPSSSLIRITDHPFRVCQLG